jgi:4-amino-4-deoxy-L-arabinose transferase-like glycosyltransferase
MKREDAKMPRERDSFASLRLSALALLILFLAFAVRFHLLGAQSLWNDEGSSYVQATRSLSDIAANAARDIHPPGYYWLLHLWRLFTGDTEFALRSLSALASVLAVALTYTLGKRLYSPAAGLAAALLVTLNTFQIYYAQEARMYALLALWGAAGMGALVGLITSPPATFHSWRGAQARWALALALINAAGLWTQYAYPFVMLAQGVIFGLWWFGAPLAGQRFRALLVYVLANLLTIALYLPWLPKALYSLTTWPNTGQPVPLSEALGVIVNWFTLGLTASATDASWVAVGLLFLLFGLLIQHPMRESWRALLPVVWAALPVGLFLALGMFREANLKLLLPAQIGFALWLGRGAWVLAQQRPRQILMPSSARQTAAQTAFLTTSSGLMRGFAAVLFRITALYGILALAFNMAQGLEPLYHAADFQRADYRRIAADITPGLRADDAVILNAPNQEEVFRYYYAGPAPLYPLPPGLGGDDADTRRRVEDVIAAHDRIYAVFWGEAERDPNRIVEKTLDMAAFEIDNRWYGDVRLARYAGPVAASINQISGAQFGELITLRRYSLSADAAPPGTALRLTLIWQANAPLEWRYKVFVQLLDAEGRLVAQRDSEPGGGQYLTTDWPVGEPITDRHALIIPDDLSPTHYTLIIGIYNINNPRERLSVGDSDYLALRQISVTPTQEE